MARGRRNRITLSELTDMLNIGGDIEYKKFGKKKKREAESLMHLLTSKGEEAVRGKAKGKGLLDVASFLANFIPIPGWNKAISASLQAAGTKLQDNYVKEKTKEFRNLATNISTGTDYANYKQSGAGAILSQVEQANELQRQENMKKLLMDVAMKTGIPQAGVGKAGEAIGKSGAVKALGKQIGLDPAKMVESFQSQLPWQAQPWTQAVPIGTRVWEPGAHAAVTQAGWTPGVKDWDISGVSKQFGPSIYDYFSIINPLLKKKTKVEATYPGLPASNIPSLRRI